MVPDRDRRPFLPGIRECQGLELSRRHSGDRPTGHGTEPLSSTLPLGTRSHFTEVEIEEWVVQ
jgi:hypothetical protein